MTPDELRTEAAWLLDFIGREWAGSAKYSRIARSLPLVLRAFLADRPADDGEETTPDWLAAVVPGFGATASGACGAVGDGWRVIAHRKPSGWAVLVSGDGCDASRICPTRGEARALLRLFGVPLKEGV